MPSRSNHIFTQPQTVNSNIIKRTQSGSSSYGDTELTIPENISSRAAILSLGFKSSGTYIYVSTTKFNNVGQVGIFTMSLVARREITADEFYYGDFLALSSQIHAVSYGKSNDYGSKLSDYRDNPGTLNSAYNPDPYGGDPLRKTFDDTIGITINIEKPGFLYLSHVAGDYLEGWTVVEYKNRLQEQFVAVPGWNLPNNTPL